MTNLILKLKLARLIIHNAVKNSGSGLIETKNGPKARSTVPVSAWILISLLVTLTMIVLHVVINNHEGSISTAGIITSFFAGMFGYATLEFLRRGWEHPILEEKRKKKKDIQFLNISDP